LIRRAIHPEKFTKLGGNTAIYEYFAPPASERTQGPGYAKQSAGILLFVKSRAPDFTGTSGRSVLAKKDESSWSFPKGEYDEGEDALAEAKRELREETASLSQGIFLEFRDIQAASGKLISAWAIERDLDPVEIKKQHVFR